MMQPRRQAATPAVAAAPFGAQLALDQPKLKLQLLAPGFQLRTVGLG
jgi:hypothetical protein